MVSAERSELKVYLTLGTAVVSSRWKGRGTYDGRNSTTTSAAALFLHAFGVLLGVGAGLLIVVFTVYDLPLVEFVMKQNIHWVRFVAYTVVIFVLLVNRCRPQSLSTGYWTMLGALLLLHFVGYIWFISRVKPLGAIHYIVAAPFECLLLYFLLDRGTRFLATGKVSTTDEN